MECLCKLLPAIGQMLEDQLREAEAHVKAMQKQNKEPKWVPEPGFMDHTCQRLKDLVQSETLSSKIRFAIIVSSSMHNILLCSY